MAVMFASVEAPPEASSKKQVNEPKEEALGYSQGGLGTKIHLIADSTETYINPF